VPPCCADFFISSGVTPAVQIFLLVVMCPPAVQIFLLVVMCPPAVQISLLLFFIILHHMQVDKNTIEMKILILTIKYIMLILVILTIRIIYAHGMS